MKDQIERERDVERYLNDGVRNRLRGISYKFVSPGNDGVPDRIVILPRGVVYFVELKTTRGRLSPRQQVQLRRIRDLGCNVCVLYGREDVEEFLTHPDDFAGPLGLIDEL